MNAAKAKGTSWETGVARWLHERGHDARRVVMAGSADRGDIHVEGWPQVILECKSVKAITLSTFVDEANAEAKNAGRAFGVAVVKRRGKTDPGAGYVVLDMDTFERLMRLVGRTADSGASVDPGTMHAWQAE